MDTTTTITHIGKYEILGELGRGGMGVVYRGEDKFIGREVAIKTLTDATPELRQRFLVEARSGVLNHQNIVTVYDFGEHNGNPYIVMEYLQGDSLEKVLRSGRPLSMIENLEIIRQVCSGLAYAHTKGVVHRDIKPANVMVQTDGQIKLVDFGIARLGNTSGHTATGAVIGTFHYISPERLRGQASDGRADIWSAGIMLYQMLTGQLPFGGEDASALHKVVNEPFTPLSHFLTEYPAGLDQVLDRALAKQPGERYDSADEMAADLESINEVLKRARAGEMLSHVRELMEQQQLAAARPLLIELQRLVPQNTEIKRLLRELQERLSRQQKTEQIRQIVAQAEEAVLTQRYAEALDLYKQASALDPADPALIERIEQARTLKDRADRVLSLKQQAREARHRNDLTAAGRLIEQALELDARDTDLRNERVQILQEAERTAREGIRRKLSQAGREQLASRQFTGAIQSLRDALEIDPTDPEVQQLFQEAVARQEEERRRRVIEQIVAEIQDCIYREDTDRAMDLIGRALERLPGETVLLRLKAETEKRQHEVASRRLVEQTSLQVQTLFLSNPQEALACVQQALDRMPGEPRLVALEERVVEQLKRANLDGLRAQYLKRAQSSIDAREFNQAIQILETTAIDCGESPDVTYLLDYARTEKQKEETRRLVASVLQKAQALIANGELEGAIAVLQPAARETGDASLEQLLRQTAAGLAEVARRLDAVVSRVQQLSEEDSAQALQLLTSQPQAIQQHSRLRELRARLDAGREQERLTREAIQRAETLLEKHDLRNVLDPLESVQRAYGDSPRLLAALEEYKSRRTPAANALLAAASETARQSILAHEGAKALEQLRQVADAVHFADAAAQADWNRLVQEAVKAAGAKHASVGTDTMQIVVKSGRPSAPVLAAIAACLLLLVGGLVWYLRPAPVPPTSFLQLNATPFAEIVSVTPDHGPPLKLPKDEHMTPMRLDGVAFGNYLVVFRGADGATQTQKCVVDDAEQLCSIIMKPIGDVEIDQIIGGER